MVGREMTANDALKAHVREGLGLSEAHTAKPLQAALASGLTFSIAAAVPLASAVLAPKSHVIAAVDIVTLVALAVLGAYVDGARMLRDDPDSPLGCDRHGNHRRCRICLRGQRVRVMTPS